MKSGQDCPLANTWFRLYAEFASDPKVLMPPEAHQARLIKLMCLRCNETLETLHETELAFHLRISEEELAKTKELFIERRFIDESWGLVNWNKRQFLSDSSTERVRRHRQGKKQDETLPNEKKDSDLEPVKRRRNVTNGKCNGLDTDTEADSDTEQRAEQTLALTSPEVPAVHASLFELPLPGNQGEWGLPCLLYTSPSPRD